MLEKELVAAANLTRAMGALHAAITAEKGDYSAGSVHVHAMESLFLLVLAFLTTTTTTTAHSSSSSSSSSFGTKEAREAFKGCVRACDTVVESFHEAPATLQAHPDFAQVSARCADITEQMSTHHDAVEGAMRKHTLF
jgi:hypothetical protein